MISFKLDIVPPTATAQQKGAFVRGGHIHFFKKAKVRDAEEFLAAMIAPYRPANPIEGPVCLEARWCFPFRKSEKKSIVRAGAEIGHITRPDLDNLEKNLLDVLTRLQFWRDDSQVCAKTTSKAWGPQGFLKITIKSIQEGE